MGEANRRIEFKYLPNAPNNASFPIDIIKITRDNFISMLGPNKTAFLEKRAVDSEFAEIMHSCIKYIKQVQDPRLPTKLCLLCDYEYDRGTPPAMLVIMRPHTTDAHTNVFNVLCPRCAKLNYDVIDTKVIAAHQKTFPEFSVSWTPQCD